MPTSEHILNKIKLLLNLVASSNPNESANAQMLADKLIEKHGVTEEELAEIKKQPITYNPEALLFHTFTIIGWLQHLALACAKQFYCHVVVETIVPFQGAEEYNYYVYGEDNDVIYSKFAFNTFHKKITQLLDTKCIGRGDIYKSSYCEGVVEAIKGNIAMWGIDIPVSKQVARVPQQEKILSNGNANLSTNKGFKEKPEKETMDVDKHSQVKDVQAYFRGIHDGNSLDLQDVLELEACLEYSRKLEA